MAFTLQKLADAPLVLYTQQPGAEPFSESAQISEQLNQLLDQQPEPVFVVHDLRGTSFDIGTILNVATRVADPKAPRAVMHHPNIRRHVLVVTDPVLRMAVAGLRGATFGRVRLDLFETIEAALVYCYESLAPH